MSHTLLVVVAVVAIVAYVIGRQLLGEPLRGKRVVLLPTVLTVVGAFELGSDGRHPQPVDLVFVGASAVVAAGIGLAQGAAMRLECRDGSLWGQLPVRSLWLWAALLTSRVVFGVAAGVSGAHVAASTAPILLALGVNRLAQAVVIAARAMRSGIPFAPEKDGSVFLAGLLATHDHRDAGPSGPTAASTTGQLLSSLGTALLERHEQRRR